MVVEAGLGPFPELRDHPPAGPNGIDLLDGVERLIDRSDICEGTEIPVPVSCIVSRDIYSWKILICCNLNKRKMLVILKQHIVSWTVLLDEVHFQDQRFHFAVSDDVLKFSDLADHDPGLFRMILCILKV